MLIDRAKYVVGDTVSFKMGTGEEIIGKLTSEDDDLIIIERPLMLAMTPKGPAMAPVMMTVDPKTTLTFNKRAIAISPVETDKEISEQYTFQTTGIQPISAGSIIR
jgi:hypothetical protein